MEPKDILDRTLFVQELRGLADFLDKQGELERTCREQKVRLDELEAELQAARYIAAESQKQRDEAKSALKKPVEVITAIPELMELRAVSGKRERVEGAYIRLDEWCDGTVPEGVPWTGCSFGNAANHKRELPEGGHWRGGRSIPLTTLLEEHTSALRAELEEARRVQALVVEELDAVWKAADTGARGLVPLAEVVAERTKDMKQNRELAAQYRKTLHDIGNAVDSGLKLGTANEDD